MLLLLSKKKTRWLEDSFLRATYTRLVHNPNTMLSGKPIQQLTHLGDRVTNEMWKVAKQMEQPENYPRLTHVDAWGKRVDDIYVHDGWYMMHRIAAEEGVIADGYDKSLLLRGDDRRLLQYTKLYLYQPSAALYGCPLAMTDGAARVLQMALSSNKNKDETSMFGTGNYGQDKPIATMKLIQETMKRLVSRNATEFWTSGQWMTERKGGSDVANGTETIAKKQSDGTYKLFGYKWFTSATTADVALTLARIVDEKTGLVEEGSSGLSCFLLKVRQDDGVTLNNIRVIRLKTKLGTKSLPTAEMELMGTEAHLISLPRRGVATITSGMVNITRLHNAITAASSARRMVALMRDYCHRRRVFGTLLKENALHLRTVAHAELLSRAMTASTFDMVCMLGRVEDGIGSSPDEQELLRLLTPVLKAWTAKECMSLLSEGLESFGGQGYQEDTGLPSMLRNAQVMTIWEGTTNVLSHDVLRVVSRSKGKAMDIFLAKINERCLPLDGVPIGPLRDACEATSKAAEKLITYVKVAMSGGAGGLHEIERNARDVLMSLGRIYAASSLIAHAAWSKEEIDILVAQRFATEIQPLLSSSLAGALSSHTSTIMSKLDQALALDIMEGDKARGYGDVDERGRERCRL
jgi:alkylation response protein AidB-like acyl-CoA dehydrogenase